VLKEFFERFPEFDIENGVYNGVEKAIDISKPDEKRERHRMNVADGRLGEEVVTNTYCVDDIQREKRNPTQQENPCKRRKNKQSQLQ
jgi:hypothetical protein